MATAKKEFQTTAEMPMIKLSQITLSSTNPRKTFDEEAIEELAESIKEKGVITPVLVRPLGKNTYELVCGERRYRASTLVKDAPTVDGKIPAYIREMSDEEALELQITENLQRKDVHPMEEAVGFLSLLESGRDAQEIAHRVGKSVHFVNQRLKLNSLNGGWQRVFYHNKMSLTDALKVAMLTPEQQEEVYNDEGLADSDLRLIREVTISDWQFKKYRGELKDAPFPLDATDIIKNAGACTNCRHNSAAGNLFPEQADRPICYKLSCFQAKSDKIYGVNLQEAIDDPEIILVHGYRHNQAKVDKLAGKGHEILAPQNFEMVDTPVFAWDDYEDFFDNNSHDYETEEDLKKAWAKELEDFNNELTEYNQKVATAQYHRAFVVEGDERGRFIYIKMKKGGKAGSSSSAPTSTSKEEPTSITAIKAEIDRIESKEKRSKELDEEKVHERMKDALKGSEFWFEDTALTHQELMGAVIMLYHKLPWNADDMKVKILGKKYGWGTDENLFVDLIQLETEAVVTIFNKLLRYVIFEDLKGSIRPSSSDKGAALDNIARLYVGKDLSTFKLEQQEKSIKREHRVNKRLEELRGKLAELELKKKQKADKKADTQKNSAKK